MGFKSIIQQVAGLGKNINKVNEDTSSQEEGVVSDLVPELKLEMSDQELVDLKNQWITNWNKVSGDLAQKMEDNENYWLGKQYSYDEDDSEHPLVDNIIFESLETFLPIITKQKAEPLVSSINLEMTETANKVRKQLAYWTDKERLNLKVKKAVRFWALDFVGCIKMGWSMEKNDIVAVPIKPENLILDADSYIDDTEYLGEYIGEYREDTAGNLIKRYPNKKTFILSECKDKLATKLKYIEWWTDDYVFWTLKEEVLGKIKNPHWNYDTTQETFDEWGMPMTQEVEGINHFEIRKKPYVFLSVFSLQKHPYDDTGIIHQVLALQDSVNKRKRQIDINIDSINNGFVVSGDHFSKEQAGEVADTINSGGTLYVPSGDVNAAYKKEMSNPLPQQAYQELTDSRNELRGIFGVSGSNPQGIKNEDTVRGKLIIRGQDADRGSLISAYVEQMIDSIYNWVVQMMYVYYDQEHYSNVLGVDNEFEFNTITNQELFQTKLLVSVKEGSMIPKDPLLKRNEAMDLWSAGAIDPLSLYVALDYPNPQEMVRRLILWQSNPIGLLEQQQTATPMSVGTETLPNEIAAGNTVDQQIMQGAMAQQGDLPPLSSFENQ